jgi:hypothetical protein
MIEFTMVSFNCVGDEIAAAGLVTAVRDDAPEQTADLDLWVDGPRGRTVKGGAAVAWPTPTDT